jgi:hypothetical protein
MDASGNWHWNVHLNNTFADSPVIAPDGTVYVNAGRMLTAISVTNHPVLAKSSWPMWRGNPQHTGRMK